MLSIFVSSSVITLISSYGLNRTYLWELWPYGRFAHENQDATNYRSDNNACSCLDNNNCVRFFSQTTASWLGDRVFPRESFEQYTTPSSDNRNSLHRGIVHFFIEKHNRPRFEYINAYQKIEEIHFKTEDGKKFQKKANFLVILVGNKGNSDALKPHVGLIFEPTAKKEWQKGVRLSRKMGEIKFKEIPLVVFDNKPITNEQLAHGLITKGLEVIESVGSRSSEEFVIGFAFEDSENYFLAIEDTPTFPLNEPISVRVGLSGIASNITSTPLSGIYDFALVFSNWKEFRLLASEEKLRS